MTSLVLPPLAFERVNRHRALAEWLIYNRNWVPSWILVPALNSFCDHGERYLRGESQPPFIVRAWWLFKHLKFRWQARRRHQSESVLRTLDTKPIPVTAGRIIPLPAGQRIDFVPVKEGEMVEVINFHTKERKSVLITPEMQRDFARGDWFRIDNCEIGNGKILYADEDGDTLEIDKRHLVERKRKVDGHTVYDHDPRMAFRNVPNYGTHTVPGMTINVFDYSKSLDKPKRVHLSDLPRPDCPKCHRSHPSLGTPLTRDKKAWGDPYFTCNGCGHSWLWKKVFPDLQVDQQSTVTLKGCLGNMFDPKPYDTVEKMNAVAKIVGRAGVSTRQFKDAIRTLQRAGSPLPKLTPEQQYALSRV